MPDNPLMLKDLLEILLRRKWYFALPAGAILLLSVAAAFLLPSIYVSTAKILIEQQEIPKDLVATTVTGYAAERITLIRNRVMTRDNLWAIAEQFDLYPLIRTLENQEEIVTRLREEILLEMVSAEVLDPRSGRSVTATIAFTVSYQSESPELAQKVTAKVAELYLDENRRSRTELAQQTSAFLSTEAERLREEISVLESKVAEFKAKNASYLPESIDISTRSLDSALQQRAQLVARLGPLEARYGFLRSQLAVSGQSSLLAQARAELAAARQKYSEIHPDVVRLKRTVETLEAEARQGGGTSPAIAADPALRALQSESYDVAGNISATRAQMADLDRKIAEYQKRLAESPEAEREYTALTRDLTHATEKYRQIMDKLTGAQLAEELEREQKAERFTLVESASYPSSPSKPNRLAIILLGFTFALAVGVGVAGLAQYLDRRILGPRELAAVFKAPPMAIIPDIPAVGTRR